MNPNRKKLNENNYSLSVVSVWLFLVKLISLSLFPFKLCGKNSFRKQLIVLLSIIRFLIYA